MWNGTKAFLEDLIEHLTPDKRQNMPQTAYTSTINMRKKINYWLLRLYLLVRLFETTLRSQARWKRTKSTISKNAGVVLSFICWLTESEIPLIIDQPEENLDNQTVYKHLSMQLKRPRRRQIIIVTHNPNLVVVMQSKSFAARLTNKNRNRIEYFCGAIENPEINKRIVDILEGTKPALTNRWRKYSPFNELM